MTDGVSFHEAVWRRACNGGSCVEVAFKDGCVGVRDSKHGHSGPVLSFTTAEWLTFIDHVKQGGFDLPK